MTESALLLEFQMHAECDCSTLCCSLSRSGAPPWAMFLGERAGERAGDQPDLLGSL